MTKQEVRQFINTHRDIEYSAAKFEYSLYLYKDIEENMYELAAQIAHGDGEERAYIQQMITDAESAEDIVDLMRKKAFAGERLKIIKKALEIEEATLPIIQKRALSNRQDIFIENTVRFFLQSRTNCCDWIMENYQVFKSEYLKSMLCLVLGFRGDVGLIDFLMKEAKRLEREYPFEAFDQGPALAVQELAVRFLNDKKKRIR